MNDVVPGSLTLLDVFLLFKFRRPTSQMKVLNSVSLLVGVFTYLFLNESLGLFTSSI